MTNFELLSAFVESCRGDDYRLRWNVYPCVEWTKDRWVSNPFATRMLRRFGHKTVRRVAYMLAHGEIPEDHIVLDLCRNPKCIRPIHLRTRTNSFFPLLKELVDNPPDDPKECILWPFAKDHNGYGRISNPFRDHPRMLGTHQCAWEYVNERPIPKGEGIHHECDIPLCIRGSHLTTGTQTKNMADCQARGRTARGPALPQSRLNPHIVRTMRHFSTLGMTCKEVADRMGENYVTTYQAINRISWNWLD